MAKPFTVVASDRYVRVYREDGSQLSQHLTVEDALEAAVAAGPGRYRIRYPERVVDVSKAYGILADSDTSPPTTPTNLAVTDVTANSVSLSWTASTDDVGVTAYQVWRDGVPAGTTAETTFVDTGLTPGTAYDYMVAANDAAGNQSAQTAEVTATTDSNAAPVWNTNTQALTVGLPYSLTLSSVCSDPDGDTITFTRQSGVLPAGISFANGVVSGTPTTVQSSPVTFRASDPYTYTDRVITFVVSQAPDTTAPSVPTALTVTATNPTTLVLTWGQSTDPAVSGQSTSGLYRYKIYRNGLYYDYRNVGTLTYTDSNLSTPGLYSYSYQVSAIDVAGNESALTAARTASAPPAGTVTINSIPAIDFVQGLAGQSFDMSGYVDYSGTETLTYAISTGSLPTGVSLSAAGDLSYNGSAAVGSGTVSMSVVEYAPPPAAGDFVFTEIPPELVTVTGIGDTEQLGIYMIDVANRWTPGDFTRASGWTTATPVYLRLDSDDSIIDTTGNAWISYNSTTMELTLKANTTAADHVVYLEREGTESARFTIRHLVPTRIWGVDGQPAIDKAAFGWTNAVEYDAATATWEGPTGIARTGAEGRTHAAPRVIFICGQTIPYQGMNVSGGTDNALNNRTFLYIIGDPRSTPSISRSTASGLGTMNIHASWAMFYVKNLSLGRIGIYQTTIGSNTRANQVVHKVTVNVDSTIGSGDDTFGNSFDYSPYSYPSADRVDLVSGGLGTYNNCYFQFVDVRRGGRADTTKHHFYMEGTGLAGTYLNCCISAGPRNCSGFKSIQPTTKIRNSVFASAPDWDTGLASATTNERWSQDLVDIRASTEVTVTNNRFYLARKVVAGSTYGTMRAIYWRARRTSLGSDVPPYPDLLWSPPLGAAVFYGTGFKAIPGFAQGCETFANAAYWAAVRATAKSSLAHQYTDKKYIAYNEFIIQMGSPGVPPIRDDGTHPSEATNPQQNPTTVLGVHADWDERSVTFLANNTFTGYYSPSAPTPPGPSPLYTLDDELQIDVVEDGTGNAARSWYVTLTSGEVGYVRENQSNYNIRAWSESLNPRMTTGARTAPLANLPWSFGFNDSGNFPLFSIMNPHSDTQNLTSAVVGTSPQAGGTDVHVAGTGTMRDVVVTISGTWSGTITLQRSVLGSNWSDVTYFGTTTPVTWTANTTSETINDGLTDPFYYRAVFKTGAYVSGTATVTLSVPYDHIQSAVLQGFWPAAIPKASRPLPTIVDVNLLGGGAGQRFTDVPAVPYVAIPAGFLL